MAYDLNLNRRRIIASAPHLIRVREKEPVIDVAIPNIVSLNIDGGIRQSGSGAPSVFNKRSITPWYTFYVNSDEDEIIAKSLGTLAGNVYDIHYDSQTGIVTTSYISQTITTSSSFSSYTTRGNSSIFWGYAGNLAIYNNPEVTLYSNMFTWSGYHYGYDTAPDWSFAGSSAYPNSFWVKVPTSILPASSLAGATQWALENQIQVVAPGKAGGQSVDVGASNVVLTRGRHTITAHPTLAPYTTFDITYWTH